MANAAGAVALPKPPAWWRTLRADPPVAVRFAFGAGMIALLLLVWTITTRDQPSKLPPPEDVFTKFEFPDLLDSVVDTMVRVIEGVVLAAVVGVTLGLVAGASRAAAAAFAPVVIFLRSVPIGALLPLMLILFHTGQKEQVMFLFFALVAFVFSDTMKAVALVPERYVETALTLGASKLQIVTKVLVPLAIPDVITSLRFQFGLALGYVMLCEDIDTDHGLGHLINNSQRLGKAENVWMLLFIIAALAFGIDLLLRTIQRGIFAWRRDL